MLISTYGGVAGWFTGRPQGIAYQPREVPLRMVEFLTADVS